MALVKSKNTRPEMLVRRLIHGMGYRYRLHKKDLPGKPDIVFVSRKKVIFVHGCFWHGHQDPACKLSRIPKSNLDFWREKIRRNQQRDIEVANKLDQEGWATLVIWECETRCSEDISVKIQDFLGVRTGKDSKNA